MDANDLFNAALGYTRIAVAKSDSAATTTGRALFGKAAALRYGLGRFTDWYYAAGLKELPSDPGFMLKAPRAGHNVNDDMPNGRVMSIYGAEWATGSRRHSAGARDGRIWRLRG